MSPEITQLLDAAERGEAQAAAELLPLVYNELRRMAAAKLARESAAHTLQPTALVHEAYLRLVRGEAPEGPPDAQRTRAKGQAGWRSRGHFFAAAAEAMRRILIENARRKKRQRHGGGRQRVDLNGQEPAEAQGDEQLLEIDEALSRLAAEDPEAAEVVKLRFYGGLSIEEAADVIGISRAGAYRHWTYARAWLQAALGDGGAALP